MAPNPDVRASDADRDRVAASLREHCALGRITMDELQERLDSVYEAKTSGTSRRSPPTCRRRTSTSCPSRRRRRRAP